MHLGIVLVLVALLVAGGFWARSSEKKAWNNGICAECHTPWKSFDLDSQGGRGYKCGCGGHHTVWISYAVDKPIAGTVI